MLSLNRLELLEAHFGVPAARGALCAINTRLAPPEVRFIVEHCGAQVLLLDPELEASASQAVELPGVRVVRLGPEYEELLAGAQPAPPSWPDSEDRPIAVDYTSGTTGTPKGVVYTHRGAYLGALAGLVETQLGPADTLSLVAADVPLQRLVLQLGRRRRRRHSVVVPRPEPAALWRELRAGATHLCAAPTVLITLLAHPDAAKLDHAVTCVVGGAPPSPTMIAGCEAVGMRLIHMYGLTETYGPATVSAWPPEWDALPAEERAVLRARQGVPTVLGGEVDVWDPEGAPVPRDGQTMGEVVERGNTVMAGYLDDPAATAEAFRGGWFHSGDAAVIHEDGRIEMRDRFKDVIISGGENISTIEVEQVLARHPAVLDCAVVGVPDDRWGERPKAFVELRPGQDVPPGELMAFCREHLAGFKCPDAVEYGTCRARRPARSRSSCSASASGAAASAASTEAARGREVAQNGWMRRLCTLALVLAGLVLAAPAGGADGAEVRGVIAEGRGAARAARDAIRWP